MLFAKSGLFSRAAAMDLGTVNTVVAIQGKGIALNEPTAAAVYSEKEKAEEIIASGEDAVMLHGRTPGGVNIIYPMKEGVIADINAVSDMMTDFFIKAFGRRRGAAGASLTICLPMCATMLERRALSEAVRACGAREALVLEEPIAAAAGAGIDVFAPVGSMVVDIGGGTSDAAVISFGGIAAQTSVRTGGRNIDEAIVEYVAAQYSVRIGEKTAENVKLKLGAALIGGTERMQCRGRSIKTGLPETVTLNSGEISHAIAPTVRKITEAVIKTLSETPPELSADLIESGIVLTGGGSMLRGLDKLIAHETGLRVTVAEDPMYCVALGALKLSEDADSFESPVYA